MRASQGVFQSIAQRTAGRNPVTLWWSLPATSCFNPPPSAQPGGTLDLSAGSFLPMVSIHRPAHSRAEQRPNPSSEQNQRVSIHRPAHSRAERIVAHREAGLGEFQSTAQRTAGRNGSMLAACFNPPPSAQPGGTGRRRGPAHPDPVSIHRPAHSRAEPGDRRHNRSPRQCFNPPPSAQPGGTGPAESSGRGLCRFNPPPSAQPGGTYSAT